MEKINPKEIQAVQDIIKGITDDVILTKGTNNIFFTILMAEKGEVPKHLPATLKDYLCSGKDSARIMEMFYTNMKYAIEMQKVR